MILYLHGFRSSPASFKARAMQAFMEQQGRAADFVCPQLSPSPKIAIEQSLSLIDGIPASELTVIGSSLGGYYATWLAEHIGCRAVVVNPAVKPPRELESYVGTTTYYHSNEVFEFLPEYVDELRALAVSGITRPERYFLMASTGDEVLDYREMLSYYHGAMQMIIQGSDHGIAEFADHLPFVLQFCDRRYG